MEVSNLCNKGGDSATGSKKPKGPVGTVRMWSEETQDPPLERACWANPVPELIYVPPLGCLGHGARETMRRQACEGRCLSSAYSLVEMEVEVCGAKSRDVRRQWLAGVGCSSRCIDATAFLERPCRCLSYAN